MSDDSVLESLREWIKVINRINELSPLPTSGGVPTAAIVAGTAVAKDFMSQFPPPQPYGLAPTFGPRVEEVVEVAPFAALGHGISLAAEQQDEAHEAAPPEERL
ncbi:hypothetical protein ACIBH1_40800 [Nonomuraea sp. NPDC050663]|uniref:hypothetical protein n=1 Tax=Nonomuraea sp. NPDC050663 TaxID=3364370 RepID=UPI0037B920B9